MSRPFPDTFEDERSPLTPLSGGPSQSISYQANVNRRKTKKWADAKPVSYGGDDWGDEYDDEYDAAPPPQAMQKPTGYRQPGQGVGGLQQPAGNYSEGRKPYGDLPGGPQMGADRSATLPHQMRRNSFGEDDERRAFSSGPTQFPPQAGQAPQLYVQTQQPQQQNMGGSRGPGPQPMETPPIQAPGAFPETPYSVHESQRSSMGEQIQQSYQQPYEQQNYSPVNARGIPVQQGYGRNDSPVSAGRAGSAGGFTPRKSSLSQSGSEIGYGSHSRERSQEPVMKPWPGPGVASPGGTAPPATAKALPFVRPADIYKRLEEERTKERQSMESGRPSMDSIVGERGREMPPPAAPPSSAISPPTDQHTRGRSGSQSDTYGVTDSGRRLGQSLEPVVERKSEYSFMDTSTRSPEVAQKLEDIKRTESPYQPYMKQSPDDAPNLSYDDTQQHADEQEIGNSFASEESEKHRKFSTSPKLPDLNRLSGFGFDMWGAKPEEPAPAPAPEPARPVAAPVQLVGKTVEQVLHETRTVGAPVLPVEKTEDAALREQPSLGFNSVVHQAFDRNDSFSDARDPQRTNSETSVGTSDISPINTRAAFINDDQSTPMIAEKSEPSSRPGSGHITPKQERPETPHQHAPFLPGHRRDLSAPISVNSRDNSPARTPVVRQGAVVGPGVQVHIVESEERSPNSPTADEERQIEDAARYERYPRPPIPGGWTSYATIGGESIHNSEEPSVKIPADTSKIAPSTAEIIASNPLPDEFSPTIAARTEEITPPSPEVTPVIQQPATDEHSPFIAKQIDIMAPPSPAAEHAPETKAPDALSPLLAKEMDIVALPTPDPHMGPIGNPYSLTAVDPRIDGRASQPETPGSAKSVDTIRGLAPPAIHEEGVSPGSSVGPTPPPKDTPRMPDFGENEYFPPPVPLKPKTAEEVAAQEGLLPPQRPGMVPMLSTNTMPYDDENDKLRKEIVKSLSPRQSLSGASHAPHQQGQSMLGVASEAPRESVYLPSEYDSYWGATDDEPSQYSQPSQATPVKQQQPQDATVNVQAASPSSEDAVTPPIPPLNPKRVSRTSMGSIPGVTHEGHYSFDQGQERRLSMDNRSDVSTPAVVAASVPDNKPWTPSVAGNGSAKGRLPVDLQRADSASPAPLSIRSTKTDKASEVSSEKPSEKAAEESHAPGILGMAAAAGAAVAATLLPIGGPTAEADDKPDSSKEAASERDVPSLQGVVIDEDDRINDKALSAEVSPVSAMSPTHDIPAMMNVVSPPSDAIHQNQSSMSQSAMLPSPLNISRPTTAQTNHSHGQVGGAKAAHQNQPPPMQFREIMTMQTPEQRIEAYNKTRAQYATMDSGLADWLAIQTGQAPPTPPHGQDASRSRSGSVAQGAAPYYQQYLNAAPSPSTSTPVSNMGTPQRQSTLGMMGTQSSFGGRSTGHQAQQQAQAAKEKGKELLHSAGIFGGAVGKKGKGLFKKGTSRWLGGGSGDKQETPPIIPQKDANYTPSVRSSSFSTTTRPNPSFQTPSNGHGREQSPASSGRRGPYPDLGPSTQDEISRPTPFAHQQRSFTTPNHPLEDQSPASSGRRGPYPDLGLESRNEDPRPTPTKRRSSWLPHFGRPPSRGTSGDSQAENNKLRRAFSLDVGSMLSRQHHGGQEQERQGSMDGGHRFRPPFFHNRSGSNASSQQYASPQNSFGPQYASLQNSFGPGVQYASPQGYYMGTPGQQQGRQDSFGRQRSDSLPLPPGVMIDAKEVSSVASNTPPPLAVPMAPQIHLDLPETRLRDEHWLSTSPAHSYNTASPHISVANSSNSPHPSSRHASGVPSMTESERQEANDRFDKELPKPDLDDHEHTGVKPPVPIGKYQPSWDPFNATPIKEEGSEYSFGRGSVSPPKISPPVLDTVEESGTKIDHKTTDTAVLAGVSGLALAAGAATTAAVIVEQVEERREERKTEVTAMEIDEEDLYDASPPPKDKSRSMDVRPAAPANPSAPVALAAGTLTTAAVIQEQVRESKNADTPDRERIYNASPPPKSTAITIQEQLQVPPSDDKEDDIYDASPPPKSKRRSMDFRTAPVIPVGLAAGTATTAAAIHEQVLERKRDVPQEGDEEWEVVEHSDAPAIVKDEPSYFPPIATPQQEPQPQQQVFNQRLDYDHSKHSRNISSVSAVSAMTDSSALSPSEIIQAESVTIIRQSSPIERQIHDAPATTLSNIHQFMRTTSDDSPLTPPRPSFMGQQQSAQNTSTPTMEGVPGFFPSMPSVFSEESEGSFKTASAGGTDKPLPPIDKSLPWEHPDDNNATPIQPSSYNVTPTQPPLYPPGEPGNPATKWKPATSQVELREPARREDAPSVVSSEEDDEDDEKPYAAALARLDNVRNNTQQISSEPEPRQRPFDVPVTERFFWVPGAQQTGNDHPSQQDMVRERRMGTRQRGLDEAEEFRVRNAQTIHPQQSMVQSREPQVAQHFSDEAEQFRVHNAQQISKDHSQQGTMQSREPDPRQRDLDEAEQFRVRNAQAVEQERFSVAAARVVADTPSVVSEDEDDEDPYAEKMARLPHLRNNAQQVSSGVSPPGMGMVQSRAPESRQREFDEAERFRVQNERMRMNFVGHRIRQGVVRSREPETRQRSSHEAERFRAQNTQAFEKAGVSLAAGALITSQVIPRPIQENKEERRVNTTDIDDDDIYGEKSIYDASPPPKSKRRSLDMRPAVSLGPSIGSAPPRPLSGAVGQRGTPTSVMPVLAPQPGPDRVPSDFTPRTGSAAVSVQAPPMLGQERTITPRSPLDVAPMQQQRQFPQPLHHNQNQNQTAYHQSAYQVGGVPYSQLPQGTPQGPPRGQHQAYAAQLAQGPPQLKKTNSDANRNVLQKRPSSAASSNKGKDVKEKKKSFLSGLFGGRRRSAMVEKEKERKDKDGKVPLVAVLGAGGVAAKKQNPEQKRYQEQQRRLSWQQMGVVLPLQNQEQQQRMSLQQMSGAIPPPNQQFEARDPSFLQWQQGQQQQQLQAPPGGPQRILQGGPQPQQQQYDSPPIPGPYAHVRGDGSYGPINQGPMILDPHQQQTAAALRQSQQPVFADRRSYDEYMRQQQAAQAQQQGHYANLPPPPAQSYTQGRQDSVPPNFRRASQEYVRDLNQRSSQEYRRDSNPMAGGQQLNQTYTQQLATQRPPSQRKEQIAVAIPAWKRAIRDTPGTTSPVQRTEPSPPPALSPQGDFPHLTAYNPNANKSPDTPEPQGRSRPFLGLNDDRRNSNLSTEDLLARSPARAQFGQQAPYQLSLPGGDEDDELDSPHSRGAPGNALVGAVAAGAATVALGAAAAAGHRERQKVSSPLRENQHQHQAMNVPQPDTAFSPMAERGMRGEDVPLPPIPKWSAPPTPSGMAHNVQLGHPAHHTGAGLLQPAGQPLLYPQNQMLLSPNTGSGGVGRSNTVMSDVSSITIDSNHTPNLRQHAPAPDATGHGHQESISTTSPVFGNQLSPMTTHSVSPRSSPNDTPVVQNATSLQPIRPAVPQSRTEPVVQRIHIPSDIPSVVPQQQQQPPPMPTARAPSPPHQALPGANATGGFVVQDERALASASGSAPARPTVVTQQHPDHSGLIYDNSREGLIVVEDATVRRVNQGQVVRTPEEEEAPVMSATSFPGDEWRPYGWDEGFD